MGGKEIKRMGKRKRRGGKGRERKGRKGRGGEWRGGEGRKEGRIL